MASPELWRIRGTAPPLHPDLPVVTVRAVASNPVGVVGRVRDVVEQTVEGLTGGRPPEDPRWREDLPGWFVRSFPRDGFGSLSQWLTAMTEEERAWRWWSSEDDRVRVLVGSTPYSLEVLAAVMESAGAHQVAVSEPERRTDPADLPWSRRPRRSTWDLPRDRLLWALATVPFFGPVVLVDAAVHGWPADLAPSMAPVLAVLTVVAAAETVLAVRWLRRPVRRD